MLNRAQKRLVREHSDLVEIVARSYADKGVEWNDLLQEGFIGLIEAAPRYRPEFSREQFRGYASWYIRSAMIEAIQRVGLITLRKKDRKARARALDAVGSLVSQGIHEPTIREIAAAAGLTEEETFDAFIGVGCRADIDVSAVAVHPPKEDDAIFDFLDEALVALSERSDIQYRTVCMWFGLRGWARSTRRDIAASTGHHPVYVSVDKNNGVAFIRQFLLARGFRPSRVGAILTRNVA